MSDSDIVKIARECRAALAAEVTKIDGFVRMAEALSQYSDRLDRGRTVIAINASPAAKTIEFIEDVRADETRLTGDVISAPAAGNAPTVTIHEQNFLGPKVQEIFFKIRSIYGNAPVSEMENTTLGQEKFASDADCAANNAEVTTRDELVLLNSMASDSGTMDVHIGQRLRQRRWMMGMSQQQLGDIIGANFDKIQKYETGASRIGVRTMWDIAAAIEVPVAYFFENFEGQAADIGESGAEILTDEEATQLVVETARVRRA